MTNYIIALKEVNTGINTLEKAHDVLTTCLADPFNCYCFWGKRTISSQTYNGLTYDKKRLCTEVDGHYVMAEDTFIPVTGYENVLFDDAIDKSVYHPGTHKQPSSLHCKLTVVQKDNSSTETTFYDLIHANDTYMLYMSSNKRVIVQGVPQDATSETDNTNAYYSFAFVKIDDYSFVPWSTENRFGVIREVYDHDKKIYQIYSPKYSLPGLKTNL